MCPTFWRAVLIAGITATEEEITIGDISPNQVVEVNVPYEGSSASVMAQVSSPLWPTCRFAHTRHGP